VRWLRAALALAAAMAVLLMTATPALADVNQAITSLQSANLYVDPAADAKVDQNDAASSLSSSV